MDGVPILTAPGFVDEMLDIERIEVLRGPQGTIYGKGTETGAINIITRQPDNEFRGKVSAQVGKLLSAEAGDKEKGEFSLNLSGLKYKSFAKAYFAVQKWTEPKALGHDLEIIPTTDLSNVHVGDMVSFEVTFMGRPLSSSPDKSLEYLTATSNAFGGPDGFFIGAMIFNGKAQFRMPVAGQWVVNVYFSQDVTPKNELKHLADKCTRVVYAGSVSFHVKP